MAKGALATVGIDYYKLGRQTADIAYRVLQGEDPAEIPIEYQNELEPGGQRGRRTADGRHDPRLRPGQGGPGDRGIGAATKAGVARGGRPGAAFHPFLSMTGTDASLGRM